MRDALAPLSNHPVRPDPDLIENLRDGCVQCGESDDGAIELFDIEGANDLMEDAAEAIASLLAIARRWTALDAGAWHVERHAAEKAELLAQTKNIIAQIDGGEQP